MAQAPPLDITPQLSNGSPYSAPNNPYAQRNPVVAALAQTASGAANGLQSAVSAPGAGAAPAPGAAPAAGSTPNYAQAGQQLGGNLVNMVRALAGKMSPPSNPGVETGDAYGGNKVNPLP